MSVGKFFAGFVIGGVVGGVVGVLLAPSTGEESRKMLADNSSEVCKSTESSLKELQSKANIAVDDLQKKGDEILKKVQDMLKKEQAE